MKTLLEVALAYARKGLPVFPCKLDKSPLTPNGFKNATTGAKQIRAWWTQWPGASIGARMGTASGWLAIDVDPKTGGDKSFQILVEDNGGLPETLHSWTGGGGDHYFFQVRGRSFASSVGILAPGIDVRAEDAYVILPPSPHPSGRFYAWASLEKTRIADLPLWLERKLMERRNGNPPPQQGVPVKIPAGMRDNWLTSQAGSYARRGDSIEIIFEKLKIDYTQRCEQEPPKTEKDFKRIAKSVWGKEQRRRATEPSAGPPKADIPPSPFPAPAPIADPEVERLPVTEMSNAVRLVVKHGVDLRYAYRRGVWCAWRGEVWNVDDCGEVMRRMADIVRDIYLEAANEADEDLRKRLAGWAKKSESLLVQKHSVELASCLVDVEVYEFGSVFDTDSHLVNLPNATIELS
jgi:hypothetical protein